MKLLIVEDDPDGREVLAEVFRAHDWDVTAVGATDDALGELNEGGVDVIISDENIEGESGSSMLRRASAAGLLVNVGALMYTAEARKLEVPSGVRVLHKPLGITVLLAEAMAAVPTLRGPSVASVTSPGSTFYAAFGARSDEPWDGIESGPPSSA